jgi:hypothetical protein
MMRVELSLNRIVPILSRAQDMFGVCLGLGYQMGEIFFE